jgi:hypothetical protein
MPADTIVILLIWAFYALECLAWGRRDVVYFRTLAGERWRIVRPSRLLENTLSGLAVLFPVPPLGVQAPAYLPDMAFSPEGVSAYVPESGDTAQGRGTKHYLYGEIRDIRAAGAEVLINGKTFVQARSKGRAAALAELIGKLKEARVEGRGKLIERQIKGLFDRDRIAAAAEGFKEKTGALLLMANALWALLIAGLPAVLYVYGFSRVVLPVLGASLLLHAAIVILGFRAHRSIYGSRDHSLLYVLLPSPFHSVRVTDLLAKKLWLDFHPFAVAGSVLEKDRFAAYARESLARIRHPAYDALTVDAARGIDGWYKGSLVRAMEETVRAMGIDVESLRRPELAGGEAGASPYSSYCPRCLGLYEIEDGACADCPDMRLVPLKGRGD